MNKISEILKTIQILYQNQEITVEEKNQLVNLLSIARQKKDFSEFNARVEKLECYTLEPSITDKLIALTY
jgi:hypothetical protein